MCSKRFDELKAHIEPNLRNIEGVQITHKVSYDLTITNHGTITLYDDTRKELKEDFAELKKNIDNSDSILRKKLYQAYPKTALQFLVGFFARYQPKEKS